MDYVGLFYGTTFRGSGATPYTATEWARAYDASVFDYSIVGEAAFQWAYVNAGILTPFKAAIMANALKYLNVYGRSAYANSYDWGAFGLGWDKGPSDVGDPSLLANSTTVYGYRMTDRHIARFQGIVEAAIISTALPCKGVFLDDHQAGRQHWNGAGRPQLWGAMNGRAGYDSDAYNWNLVRMNLLNTRLNTLIGGLYLNGVQKQILCNSGHSASYTGLDRKGNLGWMIEGYQRWYTRAYLRTLMNSGEIRAGDVLVLQGRKWTAATNAESWATIAAGNPEETSGGRAENDSYEDIWGEALEDATEFGLKIALGWHPETSEHATDGLDSAYSCLTDPSTLE